MTNKNYKLKIKNSRKLRGYSLIELTVVVGLLAMLSVAISSVVLYSIVQSRRIRSQTKVRSAGDYALGQMQYLVRGAKEVVDCDSTDNSLTVINQDGGETTFDEVTVGDNTHIASNSATLLTSSDTTTQNSFDINCSPTDASPNLVSISFDLYDSTGDQTSPREVKIHFGTSISFRNL